MSKLNSPVSIRTEKMPHTSDKVQVSYPLIYNLKNTKSQHLMNTQIINALNELLIEQQFYSKDLVELIANYEIKTNERDVLSLNLIVYSFTGGAHGMTIVKSLNFDVESGKNIALKDLFKANFDYIGTISAIIQKDIAKWDTVVIEPFTKIKPDQDFYLADTSLVIYFQLYDLAPYSSGFPYFPIPLLDLQDGIRPNSIADRLLPFT